MKKSKRGQSTLELALVMVLFLSMLSITFNAVMAFSIHQYFSYVAFMSARALQASGATPSEQRTRAANSLRRYIPGMTSSLLVNSFKYKPGGRELATNVQASILPASSGPPSAGFPIEATASTQGVVIDFQVPFVSLPLGPSMRGALQNLDMRVISYLGREPTVQECRQFFEMFFQAHARVPRGDHDSFGMEDTGC